MKKGLSFAAPVTVALVLGLAVYAVPAMGTSNSLAGRVAKLEAANKRLAATVAKLTVANTKLTKRVVSLESFAACNNEAAPVSLQGDPDNGSGFEFTPDNKVTVTLLRGIVPTPANATPDDFLQLVDPKCIAGKPAGPRALVHRSH